MNLRDLTDLQSSDEDVWGTPNVSFEIETRSDDGEELIQRKYVFNYAKEWDKWTFSEFEERRTDNTNRVSARSWRRTRHIYWSDGDTVSVDVPPEVTEKLEELLDVDSITLQHP